MHHYYTLPGWQSVWRLWIGPVSVYTHVCVIAVDVQRRGCAQSASISRDMFEILIISHSQSEKLCESLSDRAQPQ